MLGFGDKDRVNRKGTSSLNIGCSLTGETMGIALRGAVFCCVWVHFVYSYSLVNKILAFLRKLCMKWQCLKRVDVTAQFSCPVLSLSVCVIQQAVRRTQGPAAKNTRGHIDQPSPSWGNAWFCPTVKLIRYHPTQSAVQRGKVVDC